MIQAVVFDFDGVILESADCKTDAFVELYEPHGPDVVAKVRAHHLANLGISRFKKFAWIAEHVLHVPHTEEDGKRPVESALLASSEAELARARGEDDPELWADAAVGRGATFFFTLGDARSR